MALFCVLSFKFNIQRDVSQHENLHIDWNGKLVLNTNNLSMLTDYKVIHLHHKGESSLTYVLVWSAAVVIFHFQVSSWWNNSMSIKELLTHYAHTKVIVNSPHATVGIPSLLCRQIDLYLFQGNNTALVVNDYVDVGMCFVRVHCTCILSYNSYVFF